MSMTYWGIKGFGVNINDIFKYVDKEKVNKLVRLALPKKEFEDDVFEDDTFYGDPYTSFAGFLWELDDKKILCYDDDGAGNEYLLYEPPYPWCATKNEPKTRVELENYIIFILKKVCVADAETLRKNIGYISTYGAG